MSLQEPQEQFERAADEPVEEPMDEVQNPADESPLSESDIHASSEQSESAAVPTPERLTPLSEDSIHTEGVEGPAWYVIHCYSGYENKEVGS